MIWKRMGWILLLAFAACTSGIPAATPDPTDTSAPPANATPTQPPTLTPEPDMFALAEPIRYDINRDIWVNMEETVENGEPAFFKFSGVEGQEIYLNTKYPPT